MPTRVALLALLLVLGKSHTTSLYTDVERAMGAYQGSRTPFINPTPLCQFEIVGDEAAAHACTQLDNRCVTPTGMCAVNIASCHYVKLQNGACMKAPA